MKLLSFDEKFTEPVCIALGFYDCIHIGHIAIMEQTVACAKRTGCKSAVFTFCNNPFESLGKDTKLVLSFDERIDKLSRLHLDLTVFANFSRAFMEQDKQVFLDKLFTNFNVKGIVCGEDYTFGKNQEGNIAYLERICYEKNVSLSVVKLVEFYGKKASSSLVRELLLQGDIHEANLVLGHRYAIKGEILHGRSVGRTLGYPTANIIPDKSKLIIKCGVYKTYVNIDGKTYAAVTNVGAKPTFMEDAVSVESYIVGFDGDLYGKTVVVEFERFIRGIIKFEDTDALKAQIQNDIKEALN